MVGRVVVLMCQTSATARLLLLLLSSFAVVPSTSSSSALFANPPPRLLLARSVHHHRTTNNGDRPTIPTTTVRHDNNGGRRKKNNDGILRNIRGGDIATTTTTLSMTSSSSLSISSLPAAVLAVLPAAAEALRRALSTGTPPLALGALYAVSAATVVPLTWHRTGYSFSVGYGLSVSTMSLALLLSFAPPQSSQSSIFAHYSPPRFATLVALAYGLRLAAYIYVREQTVREKRVQFDSMNKTPPLKRTPLALGVSLLYAFMVSPALFALRGSSSSSPSPPVGGGAVPGSSAAVAVQSACAALAAIGMVLEAVADQHKYVAKRRINGAGTGAGDDGIKFVGPVSWSYRLCRHPNYLGEILHWVGLFGVGCVSFGDSPTAWVAGVLGLWGILGIMFGASSRLDKKQSEKYGGLAAYEEWRGRVRWSVIPFIK